MTSSSCATGRPFTVAVCTPCISAADAQLLQVLRESIRRCPHGVLVSTECLLGQVMCATRPANRGAILLLQPCSVDRIPTSAAHWIGPINSMTDMYVACDWISAGSWEHQALPCILRADLNLVRSSRRN